MVKFGNICDVDATTCRVRVQFDGDDVVSHWLPVVVAGSRGNQYFHVFDTNTHVVCMLDERGENGVCLGAIYDSQNKPQGVDADLVQVKFSDNTKVSYDRDDSVLKVEIGATLFEASPDGFEISRGGESLNLLMSDLLTALQVLTVPVVSLGSPSGVPVNAAAFLALSNRLVNLFTA